MFIHSLDPIAFTLGPISIYWYGIIYVFGIFFSYWLFKKLGKARDLKLSNKDYEDLVMYCVIGVIVGARLAAVLSDFSYYAQNPFDIIAVWQGGLAFHGGLVGIIIAVLLFCRRKKIAFYDVADLLAIPIAFALGLGRIANFINAEFYGIPTSLPWGVVFPVDSVPRHPTQLYEAVQQFIMFSTLWWLKDKSLPKGTLFWLFIVMYGTMRFALEFLKDPSAVSHIGPLTWGQFWCIPMFLIGGYMLFRLLSKESPSAR